MNRAEILRTLRQIQGTCDITSCQLVSNCELASQVASELEAGGQSDAIGSPAYDPCVEGEATQELHDDFQAAGE